MDAPEDTESYIHRSGRTARAGKTGRAITFFPSIQHTWQKKVEKEAGIKFRQLGVP